MKKTKILAVTATRAEFGLIRPIIQASRLSAHLDIELVALGAHMSVSQGSTINEIAKYYSSSVTRFETSLDSDTGVGCAKTVALSLLSLTDFLANKEYHGILILGDRYELLGVASAALCLKLPIIHVAGGHLTSGAIDDSIRHALTKLSRVHFTSTNEYRQRIIQLGEDPDLTFVVGSTGLDHIARLEKVDITDLEDRLSFKFGETCVLCTYHPETLSSMSPETQIKRILKTLESFDKLSIIFTGANTDEGGKVINEQIKNFVQSNLDRSIFVPSLGNDLYLSTLQHVDAVIGNSSSGIIEVPSFGIGTLNIGDRQQGRIRAKSVVDCNIEEQEIMRGLKRVLSTSFKRSIRNCINPFGSGNAGEQIVSTLERLNFKRCARKNIF